MLHDFLYAFLKDSEGAVRTSWFFAGIIYNLLSFVICFFFYPFFVPVLVFGEISLGTSTFGIKFTLQSETPIIFQEIFLHLCFF